jgi:hypothetical protein
MSIFWRNHPDLPNVDLPQTIMRPFWHPEASRLDDKQFCIKLDVERPWFAAALILIVSLGLLTVSSMQLYEIYLLYTQQGDIGKQLYKELGMATGMLVISLLGCYLFYRVSQVRRVCFKRDTHSVYYPRRGLIPRYQELDYDLLQGRIEHRKSPLGKRLSILTLAHDDQRQSILLTSTRDNPQTLAGFWSFIVQYMKVDAPLPDVPALHQFPNRAPGVIHQNRINYT